MSTISENQIEMSEMSEDSQSSCQSFSNAAEAPCNDHSTQCPCDPRLIAVLVVNNKNLGNLKKNARNKKKEIEETLEQYLARRYSLTMGQLNNSYQKNPKPIPRATIKPVELPPMKKMRKFPKNPFQRKNKSINKQISHSEAFLSLKTIDIDQANNSISSVSEILQSSSSTETNNSLPANGTNQTLLQNKSLNISQRESQLIPSLQLNTLNAVNDDPPQDDKCEDFAQRIAAQLKRLKSPAARVKAKLIIQQALYKDTTNSFHY